MFEYKRNIIPELIPLDEIPNDDYAFNEDYKDTSIDPVSSKVENTSANPLPIKSLNKITDTSKKMLFGKYCGSTFEEILITDPGYIIWLHDNYIKGMRFTSEFVTEALNLKEQYKNND